MGMKDDTDRLNRLSVQTVGSLLGIKLPMAGMVRCPLPGHKDKTPSFEVRHKGLRWVCYACDRRGGAIDLVMAYHGKRFIEAKQWLAERSGLASSRQSYKISEAQARSTTTPNAPSPGPTFTDESPPDHELYAAFLDRAPLRELGAQYLRQRKLSDDIISRFAIGQMPDISIVTELISIFGFKRVEASGLLTKRSRSDWYKPLFPPNALLFPYFESGQISYFQARIIEGDDKGSRWRNLNHRSRRIYNKDALTSPTIQRVAICEGAIDVLSATQLGYEAIGIIGVNARLSDSEMMAMRGKQVDLLLDWDDPGEKRAAMFRKELARFGVVATRRTAPQGGAKDINDYLQEGKIK